MLLDKEKLLLGGSVTSDDILQFLTDDATAYALEYCNLTELPTGMENLIATIVVDLYRNTNYGQAQIEGNVSAIKEGEESVSFAVNSKLTVAQVYESYHNRLNHFRSCGFPR